MGETRESYVPVTIGVDGLGLKVLMETGRCEH